MLRIIIITTWLSLSICVFWVRNLSKDFPSLPIKLHDLVREFSLIPELATLAALAESHQFNQNCEHWHSEMSNLSNKTSLGWVVRSKNDILTTFFNQRSSSKYWTHLACSASDCYNCVKCRTQQDTSFFRRKFLNRHSMIQQHVPSLRLACRALISSASNP